jgi:oxygen-independent coproporphyrinogen-3 oxidase
MKIPGLYIHIPFCVRKCDYCDFYSVTSLTRVPVFLDALFREMEMYRGRFDAFDTVYIGGGTPSVLSGEQIQDILAAIRSNFNLLPGREITVETNPGDLSLPFLESLREIGINRLNIGVQSFDQKVLDFLGRRHSAEEAASAIEDARKAGFGNIGLDLIYGLASQEVASWLDTLNRALSFEPEHLSCYQLTMEEKTPLGRRHTRGEFILPGEDIQHEFFMKTSETLEGAGYVHYEVSNFARGMTFASRHNQKYWDHTPYLGLGPAAHSFQGNQRWWNHRSVEKYVQLLMGSESSIEGTETLSMEQMALESLYLGLRTKMGIDLDDASNYAGKGFINRLLTEELVTIQNGFLCPTRSGLAVADGLTALLASSPPP